MQQSQSKSVASEADAVAKRSYRRRSEDERIADLEARIAELQGKIKDRAAREQRESEHGRVIRAIPKLQKRLREFAELATECARHDLANSSLAFLAMLDRVYHAEDKDERRRRGGGDEDEGELL
jgi:hypothetical protein